MPKNMLSDIERATQCLQQYWGYPAFRPLQGDIIQAVLKKQDVLALMPTGGGKSICFQIPALLKPGITLVITPLIALMQDQVMQLKKRHIAAAALYTGMSKPEIAQTLDRCIQGTIKLLYLSPERLKTKTFLEKAIHMDISLLAVDEAHCISQWGYDFRPAYLDIPSLKKKKPNLPIIAVTATATKQVQQDIQKKLQMHRPRLLKKSFARANLCYVARETPNKRRTLLSILKKIAGSTIIYVNRREATQRVARWLNQCSISADFYHAGLTAEERMAKQEAWIREAKRVIVATNAFGMGIDKPNVRLVVHMTLPTTLEAYYQEAGRAGRDEKKAYAVLLYDTMDLEQVTKDVAKNYLPFEALKNLYQLLANYYQVAVGSHEGVTYELDIEHFASMYGIPANEAKAGMKQLAAAGLVHYDDQFTLPAKVHIQLKSRELYAFQIANPKDDTLIKKLLECYGTSLFHSFFAISIQRIAEALKITPQKLHQQLQQLASIGVIAYSPPGKQARFTFLTPRYDIAHLQLGKDIVGRKALLLGKAKALVAYATRDKHCRTQLLCRYFGEKLAQTCKMCDVCLKKKKKNHTQAAAHKKYRPLILSYLTEKPMAVHELVEKIDGNEHLAIGRIIQKMLHQKEIAYNNHLCLVKA